MPLFETKFRVLPLSESLILSVLRTGIRCGLISIIYSKLIMDIICTNYDKNINIIINFII